jgi:hypothetical protein
MRKNEMRTGEQYEMQRGPTRGVRRVTLLTKDAPSGRSHWVRVRVEEGVGKGKEIEAPSASLHPTSGSAATSRPVTSNPSQPRQEAPPGWTPSPGEAVTWKQTLGLRFTVLEVEAGKGVAKIEGVVLGVTKQFDAAVAELSLFRQHIEVVFDSELEARLEGRLPEPLRDKGGSNQPKPSTDLGRGPNFDLVARLVFTPDCIDVYRRRFARRTGRAEAERRLRHELEHDAKRVRSTPKEYVRLQVPGRFELPLPKRPAPLQVTTIERLVFAAKPRSRQRRKAA